MIRHGFSFPALAERRGPAPPAGRRGPPSLPRVRRRGREASPNVLLRHLRGRAPSEDVSERRPGARLRERQGRLLSLRSGHAEAPPAAPKARKARPCRGPVRSCVRGARPRDGIRERAPIRAFRASHPANAVGGGPHRSRRRRRRWLRHREPADPLPAVPPRDDRGSHVSPGSRPARPQTGRRRDLSRRGRIRLRPAAASRRPQPAAWTSSGEPLSSSTTEPSPWCRFATRT